MREIKRGENIAHSFENLNNYYTIITSRQMYEYTTTFFKVVNYYIDVIWIMYE